ncbi:MAG TPA: hypothetical protein VEC14_11245, partial [Reyranellaceae bacterium]|nr:hypothetical protein [Reyranellaceae bacterium]
LNWPGMAGPPDITIDANGIRFVIQASGFGGHDLARDGAVRRITAALRAQSAAALARLEDDSLVEIAWLAVQAETADWRCWRPGYRGELPTLTLLRR